MLSKICNILSALMLTVIMVFVGILFVPRLFGGAIKNVETASMEPTIPVGSLVVIDQKATPDELSAGDVITMGLGGELVVTHRLMEKDDANRRFITMGDNNDIIDDPPVGYDQLVGKVVVSFPGLGTVHGNFFKREGLPFTIGFFIVFILLIFLPEIFKKDSA